MGCIKMREYFNGIYRDVSPTVIEQAQNATYESCSTPTEFDRLEAQVTYTAMMTDTLLVEEE